ncbi:MAG TPA: hypothetical protein PKJ05_05365 [Bacillota bacterium]|nr:hypothetical protein [Bacillota bacterium]
MPKVPGPVRSLMPLGPGRLLILGEVYELGHVMPVNGLDYINVVDTDDGTTDRQFEMIKPLEVTQVVKVNPEAVLVSAEYAGVVRWNTRDMYGEDWRYRSDAPMFMAVGPKGRAITVSRDGRGLQLLDIDKGAPVSGSFLERTALGNPVYISGKFYVPVTGGIAVLDDDLAETGFIAVEAIAVSGRILQAAGGAYLVSESGIFWFDVR